MPSISAAQRTSPSAFFYHRLLITLPERRVKQLILVWRVTDRSDASALPLAGLTSPAPLDILAQVKLWAVFGEADYCSVDSCRGTLGSGLLLSSLLLLALLMLGSLLLLLLSLCRILV